MDQSRCSLAKPKRTPRLPAWFHTPGTIAAERDDVHMAIFLFRERGLSPSCLQDYSGYAIAGGEVPSDVGLQVLCQAHTARYAPRLRSHDPWVGHQTHPDPER